MIIIKHFSNMSKHSHYLHVGIPCCALLCSLMQHSAVDSGTTGSSYHKTPLLAQGPHATSLTQDQRLLVPDPAGESDDVQAARETFLFLWQYLHSLEDEVSFSCLSILRCCNSACKLPKH